MRWPWFAVPALLTGTCHWNSRSCYCKSLCSSKSGLKQSVESGEDRCQKQRMSFSFEKDIKKRVGYMQLCIRHVVTQIETAYCSHMNGGDSVGTGGKGSGCTYGVVG